MKTIGLIGGMSWESSQEYYKIINKLINQKLGGVHSCQCVMYSVDFGEIEKLQHDNQWDKLTEIMIDAARKVEKGGADMILLCTNTMHKMAEEMERSVSIPFLHIADTAAKKVLAKGLKKVGLLGTKFTMEEEFYKGRLKEKYGIDVLIPEEDERQIIHNVIYQELVIGLIEDKSRDKYKKIIQSLINRGIEGLILGCTEIPLLIKQQHCSVPIFDTTTIHAEAAVEIALS